MTRRKMAKQINGKRFRALAEKVNPEQQYSLEEAVVLVKKNRDGEVRRNN